jgi:hypothetical protein
MTFWNRPTKLDEAFKLAKVIDVTEAKTEREDEGPKLIPLIERWRVLWNIACLKDDAKTKVKAVEIGATQYNIPRPPDDSSVGSPLMPKVLLVWTGSKLLLLAGVRTLAAELFLGMALLPWHGAWR